MGLGSQNLVFERCKSFLARYLYSRTTGKSRSFTYRKLRGRFAQAKGKALTRKGKRLFHPIRLALTGSMSGPDIGEQLTLLEVGELYLDSQNCEVLGQHKPCA